MRAIPKRKRGKVDFILLLTVIVLALFGLYMVLSTTYYSNLVKGISAYHSFTRQCIYFGVGLVLMLFFMFMDDYAWIKTHSLAIWIGAIVILILVFILGSSANGAGRWISFGSFTIQPSEFAKYMVVAVLAAYIHNHPYPVPKPGGRKRLSNGWGNYIAMMGIFCIPLALIFAQKALSMSIVLALSCIIMMIMSGVDMLKLGVTALGGVAGVLIVILKTPWRLDRVVEFLRWKLGFQVDEQGTILQSIQSTYAFGAGGLTGKGMIGSRQKYNFLPESETDFIFSIIGEEFGFIWVLVIIALYAILMIRGIHIANRARCRFGGYLALGITLIITMQTLINMFVASTLMPVTGQALPLISQGGSSLISHMAALGILLNISRETT